MTVSPLVAIEALFVAVFAGVAVAAARQRRHPDALAAAALSLALAAVAVAVASARLDLLATRVAVGAVTAGWIVTVPLWAAFVFSHTGRGPSMTRPRLLLLAGYAAAVAATGLLTGEVDGPLGDLLRVAASVVQTGLIGLGLFGVFLLLRSAMADGDLPPGQAATLSAGGVGVSLLVFGLGDVETVGPETVGAATTGLLGLAGLSFALAAVRYRPFGEIPGARHLGRTAVLEAMSDAVVVVDRDGRLVDANGAAEGAFGIAVARDAGRPLDAVVDADPGLDVGDGRDATTETAATAELTATTPGGRRTFAVSRSVLTDRRGDVVGWTCLFRDVTDRRTREQRLEVLDRVLRHNVRNDLDAIRGFAGALPEGSASETDDLARRIRAVADELVDIGETVERAEGLVTRDSLALRRVDLSSLAASVAAAVEEREDCEITVRSPSGDGPSLRTDPEILRPALLEVVGNAVEHGSTNEQAELDGATEVDGADDDGSSTPAVTVRLTETDDGVRIAVSDDGPGIPERERAVLLEGEESPLRHGTGVGLWFVSWAISRLGGELSFAETGERGTAVVVVVPDRPDESRTGDDG